MYYKIQIKWLNKVEEEMFKETADLKKKKGKIAQEPKDKPKEGEKADVSNQSNRE